MELVKPTTDTFSLHSRKNWRLFTDGIYNRVSEDDVIYRDDVVAKGNCFD
jgi:hypothetical protein